MPITRAAAFLTALHHPAHFLPALRSQLLAYTPLVGMSYFNDVDMDGSLAYQPSSERDVPRSQVQPDDSVLSPWHYRNAPTTVYPAHDDTLCITTHTPPTRRRRPATLTLKEREDRARKARAVALLKEQSGTDAKDARRMRRRDVYKLYKTKRKTAAADYMAVDSPGQRAPQAKLARKRGRHVRDKQVHELAVLLERLSW